jgi:hypothetical protein
VESLAQIILVLLAIALLGAFIDGRQEGVRRWLRAKFLRQAA